MPPRLARPASPETQVRNYMREAIKRMNRETGQWVPSRRARLVYEMEEHTVIVHGHTPLAAAVIEYRGPLGEWLANVTIKDVGKPWGGLPARRSEMYLVQEEDIAVSLRNVYINEEDPTARMLAIDGEYIGEYGSAEELAQTIIALAVCATCGKEIAEGQTAIIESAQLRAHHAYCCDFSLASFRED